MRMKNLFVGITVFLMSAFSMSVAMAEMAEERKPAEHIFYAEFDGKDDTSLWGKFNVGGDFQSYSTVGKTENGFLTTEPANTSFGRWGVFFGKGDKAYHVPVTNSNINFEIKFKVEGKIVDGTVWRMSGKRVDYGTDDNIDFADIYIKNGKFACGDRTGATVDTDVTVELGKWYILKSRISFADRKVYTDIIDESGNIKSYTSEFTWGIGFQNITQLTLHKNDKAGVKYVTDYVCLWDESFRIKSTSVKDGEKDVRIDEAFLVEFSGTPDKESLEDITLTDENGEKIEAEITSDSKTAKIYPLYGLRYNKKYCLLIPETVKSSKGETVSEKEITFITEEPPFVIGEIKKSIEGNLAKASVDVKNHTISDKTLYLLIMVYNGDGTLVKMDNVKGEIAKGTEDTVSGKIDVTDLGASVVKAYVWNGVNVQ